MNKRELRHALDAAVARVVDLERRLTECTEAHHRTCLPEAEWRDRYEPQLSWAREQLSTHGVPWQPQKATR